MKTTNQIHARNWGNRSSVLAKKSFPVFAFACLLLLVGAGTSRAATGADTWGGNISGNLGDLNWTGANNPPISGDTWVFGAAGSSGTTLNNNLTAANSVAGILFNSGASAYTISGSSITLIGGITNQNTSLETINFPMASTAVQNFITTVGGGNLTLGGVLSGTGGGITANGSGTLTLGGADTYTGATTVTGGTLTLNGSLTATASITVNPPAGTSATLNLFGNVNGPGAFNVGTVAGGSGIVNVNSAVFITGSAIDIGTAGFGTYNQTGGTVTSGQFLVCGITTAGAIGIMNISGGVYKPKAGNFGGTIGATAGVIGQVNMTGTGSYVSADATASGVSGIYVGENGVGTLNVSGSATMILGGVATSQGLKIGANAGAFGVVNLGAVGLGGGTITNTRVWSGGTGALNFHGGTLVAATGASANFLSALTSANVYGEGAVINDNGQTINITQSLLAPTGNGVSSMASFTGGAGYATAPYVAVNRGAGDGSGLFATAIAQVDLNSASGTFGQVTNIVITNPGINYTAVPTFTLSGGAPTTAATITGAAPTANVSGGLTKNGSGTITLFGANTFTNTTVVNAGRLVLAGPQFSSRQITVSDGAKLGVALPGLAQAAPSTLTVGTSTGATLEFTVSSTSQAPLAPATLAFNGTGTINIVGGNYTAGSSYPLISYSSISGSYALGSLPNGVGGNLSTAGNTIYFNVTGVTNTVWTGAVNGTWDINTTANWTNTGTLGNKYIDGSLVQFDDTGLNTTTITNLAGTIVSPAAILVTNNTYNYALKAVIAGTGVITKTGTASLTNTAANTYTGPTVINQGTVVVGVASVANASGALGNNSAVTLANNAGATLNLNNFATQIGSLTGGGTTGGNVTNGGAILTVGGDNTSPAAFAGTINGTGGLTKIGTGTLTLSGVNTYAGATAVNAGTLSLTGSGTIPSITSTFLIGTVSGTPAAVYQSGAGTATTAKPTGGGWQLGSVAGAYGYYNLSGGTMTITNFGEFDPAGSGGGVGTFGQFDMSGGSVLVGTSGTGNTYFLPCRGGVGESSVVNISGGSLTVFNGMLDGTTCGYAANWAAGSQTNVTTISGSGYFQSLSASVKMNENNNAGNIGILNLNGGTWQMLNLNNTRNLNALVNFNGGTLMAANSAQANFLGNIGAAYVYGGGAVINDNGQAITITQPLQAPPGEGVTSIPVMAGGAGYVMPPQVIISGGGGSSATAYATISGGAVTGITITSPGINYSSVPTVTLVGGGYSVPATVGTVTVASNVSGGLTKTGTGTLFLTNGVNTYAGSTVVSAGALSVVPATMGVATPLIVSNATLALNSYSASSLNVSNVVLQNNAVLSIAYGALSANPAFTAINDLGTLTAPGTNITINLNQGSAAGLNGGQFPIIAYTGTTLANISNFHLAPLPSGITANLTNNAANHSIDLNITFVGQVLTWYGSANTNWDVNTTTNWNSGNAKFLEYGTAPNLFGDLVTFDDTLYIGGPNPPSTNVNLTATLHPSQITVNSSLPYSLTGIGSLAGPGTLIMNNSGSLFLGTSNSYTGGTIINAGSVIITNDAALGTNSGLLTLAGGILQVDGNSSSIRPAAITGAATIGVLTNATYQLGGIITGSGNLTKNDNGTLVIAGTNSATGATTVSAGTLNVTGLLTNGTGSQITVGSASANGTLAITGGAVSANKTVAPGLGAGFSSGASGLIRLNSGTLTTASDLWLSSVNGGYGAFTMNGGTATVGGWLAMSRGGGSAVLNVNGGNLTVAANNLTIGSVIGTGGNNAVATLTGGNTTISAGGVYVGEIALGVLNLSGSATLTPVGALGIKFANTATTSGGILNLDGGMIVTPIVQQGPGLYGIFNFNGGTLKAATNAVSSFMSGLTAAYVYGGGAVIDDGGKTIMVSQPLLAPQGYGVSSISLSDGGSGYIDTPIVSISGGTGSNATAVATVSGGVVTGITITSPGTGYNAGDSLSVNFIGGGASAASPTVGTASLAPNVSGGLVKAGAGTLTLNGANTYTGTTVVTNGELFLVPGYQTTGAVVVADVAKFGISTSSSTNGVTIGALTLGNAGATALDFSYGLSGNPTNTALVAGVVTVNGTSTVHIVGNFAVGAFPLLQYSSLSGSFSGITAPRGVAVTLSNDVVHSTLYAVISSIGGSLVWTGTNSVSPNLWDINNTTNWLFGGALANYLQGDGVLFNDIGSGTVTLNTNASPSSMTISNNSVNYTFQGSGTVAGSAGLLKLGTGTATLSLSGDTYTGNTTISNGVLQLGSATAIPSGVGAGNVSVNSSGTLDLNGFSPAINGLSGNGTIDNSSSTALVLTLGSANSSINWAGAITNTGAGGIALTKVGSGNAIITGTNYLRGGNSAISGGTMLITNGGYIVETAGQFFVGYAGTATNIVDGGTLMVANNYLVVGGGGTNANGTLIVNSGTVQKAGTQVIVLGSLGATGTLIVNGGQVLNNGNLWLGENTGANGTLYLNGGLVQATQVRYNGTTPATYAAYFNGGTLQATASSTNFLQVYCYVQAGGLILDDNGFTLTINSAVLQDGGGGGGLVKKGAGTVYLDVGNYYSGTTIVTNGTLAGIGSISSPVVVGPGGNLGAGDAGAVAGTFSIYNDLTLQGKATLRINRDGSPTSDLVGGIANITYGGTLVISNQSITTLTTNDTFQLFSAWGTVAGNFTSIVGSPGVGLAYSFNPASGVLSVVTASASLTGLQFTASPVISGTSLTISATNAGAGTVYLLTSTNVAAPRNTWTPIWTNVLGGSGSFITNLSGAVNPALKQQFYILSNTNN